MKMRQIKALYNVQKDSLEGPQEAEAIENGRLICETVFIKIEYDF